MARLLVAALGLVPALHGVAASTPAQQDPWAGVPKPPTGCYSSQDTFWADSETAIAAMQEDIDRQEEINTGLSTRLGDIDPMEQSSRMQAFLMENPQEAMKYMEMAQKQPTAYEAQITKDNARRQELEAELREMRSRYKAALDRTVGPLQARYRTVADPGATPAEAAEAKTLPAKITAHYEEKVCPEWWGAASPFHGWLKRYKEYFLQDHIPYLEEMEEARLMNFRILGIPADTYRSTAAMKSVVDYMKQAMLIVNERWAQPFGQ